MPTLQEIKKNIVSIKPYIWKNMEKYGVDRLFIFGSYVRGEETQESDLDLLVEFNETPDLLAFIEMEEFLKAKLQIPVDLVPKRKIKARLRDQILREAVAV